MIDFSALVLGPATRLLGRPAIVHPIVSQPGGTPYGINGVWGRQPADIVGEDGDVLRADNLTFGVRVADFAVPVARGDQVVIDGKIYTIEDDGEDGEGGQTWIIKGETP